MMQIGGARELKSHRVTEGKEEREEVKSEKKPVREKRVDKQQKAVETQSETKRHKKTSHTKEKQTKNQIKFQHFGIPLVTKNKSFVLEVFECCSPFFGVFSFLSLLAFGAQCFSCSFSSLFFPSLISTVFSPTLLLLFTFLFG